MLVAVSVRKEFHPDAIVVPLHRRRAGCDRRGRVHGCADAAAPAGRGAAPRAAGRRRRPAGGPTFAQAKLVPVSSACRPTRRPKSPARRSRRVRRSSRRGRMRSRIRAWSRTHRADRRRRARGAQSPQGRFTIMTATALHRSLNESMASRTLAGLALFALTAFPSGAAPAGAQATMAAPPPTPAPTARRSRAAPPDRPRCRRRSRACRRPASRRRCPYPAYGTPVPGVNRGVPVDRHPAGRLARSSHRDRFRALAAARASARATVEIDTAPVDLAKTAILPNITGTASTARTYRQAGTRHDGHRQRRSQPTAPRRRRRHQQRAQRRAQATDLRRRQSRRRAARGEGHPNRCDRDLQAPAADGRLQRRQRVLRGARRAARDADRQRNRQAQPSQRGSRRRANPRRHGGALGPADGASFRSRKRASRW